jgi:hypothetical protein
MNFPKILPREILLLILGFLDKEDILRVAIVNKELSYLYIDDYIWKLLYIKEFKNIKYSCKEKDLTYYYKYKYIYTKLKLEIDYLIKEYCLIKREYLNKLNLFKKLYIIILKYLHKFNEKFSIYWDYEDLLFSSKGFIEKIKTELTGIQIEYSRTNIYDNIILRGVTLSMEIDRNIISFLMNVLDH